MPMIHFLAAALIPAEVFNKKGKKSNGAFFLKLLVGH